MESLRPETRVSLLQDRILYIRELDNPTPETISESAKYIMELSKEWDRFSIIVEFAEVLVPSTEVRHRVAEETLPLKEKLEHVAIVTKTNVMLDMAVKFIGALSGFKSISVYRTKELALEAILKRQNNAN